LDDYPRERARCASFFTRGGKIVPMDETTVQVLKRSEAVSYIQVLHLSIGEAS
jgi:hypothetical protein